MICAYLVRAELDGTNIVRALILVSTQAQCFQGFIIFQ
jgi:hypothetical protein